MSDNGSEDLFWAGYLAEKDFEKMFGNNGNGKLQRDRTKISRLGLGKDLLEFLFKGSTIDEIVDRLNGMEPGVKITRQAVLGYIKAISKDVEALKSLKQDYRISRFLNDMNEYKKFSIKQRLLIQRKMMECIDDAKNLAQHNAEVREYKDVVIMLKMFAETVSATDEIFGIAHAPVIKGGDTFNDNRQVSVITTCQDLLVKRLAQEGLEHVDVRIPQLQE